MFQICNKITRSLFLITFVLTTLGSVPGFAWCIGEDGHFEIEFVTPIKHDNSTTGSSNNISKVPFAHIDNDHHGPCLDLYLHSQEVLSTNKHHSKDNKSPKSYAFNAPPSIASKTSSLIVGNLISQPPPRIVKAILKHRTIVLLI